MKSERSFHMKLATIRDGGDSPDRDDRKVLRASHPSLALNPKPIAAALRATPGAEAVLRDVPAMGKANAYEFIGCMCVCQKIGTAKWLDIWDADHFDGFTDMQHCLSTCSAWFSDKGFTFWGSGETHTGRVNCYFEAPTNANYVINVELESYGGPAAVECLIDSFNYGPLGFNGAIIQPHPASLNAGGHSFRIRQSSGSFFWHGITIWRV